MHRLPESTIKLISSTQVISSVYSAVKELVENAIDAGAKSLDIKLEAFGLSRIEVLDNGTGVSKEHADMMAKNHCTSKIRCQGDLCSLSTFGFRGEALYALCSVAEVSVLSRTASDDAGGLYTFDSHGNLVSTKPSPREIGTTVIVKNLFKGFPVRKQLYQTKRKCREELNKIEEMLVEFALVYPCLRIVLKHDKHIIWQKAGTGSVRETLVMLFGSMVTDNLHDINIVSEGNGGGFFTKLSGLIRLSALSGQRATSDMKVYINVNERPVLLKSVLKHLKNYVKTMEMWAIALVVLSIFVSPNLVDANIEPNKGSVMIENMDEILLLLSKVLDQILMALNVNPVAEGKADLLTRGSTCSEKENNQVDRAEQVKGFLKPSATLQPSEMKSVQNDDIVIGSKIANSDTSHDLVIDRSDTINCVSQKNLEEGSIVTTDEQGKDINQVHSTPRCHNSAFTSNVSKGHPLGNHLENLVTIPHKENGGCEHDKGMPYPAGNVSQLLWSETESFCTVGSEQLYRSKNNQDQVQEMDVEKTPIIAVDEPPLIDDELSSDLDVEQDVESNAKGKSQKQNGGRINSPNALSLSQVTLDDWSHGIALKDSKGEVLKPASLHLPSVHNQRNVSSESKELKEKCKKPKGKVKDCPLSSPPRKRISRLPCKTVDFSIQDIQNVDTLRYRRTQLPAEFTGTKVLGKLQECNVWVVMRDNRLVLFSPFRAQECLVYQNLIKTHKLPMSKMDRSIALSEGLLGREEYQLLRRLAVKYRPSELGKYVGDQRISWNGFDIKVRTGQDCSSYGMDVVRMNQTIPFYGLKDLSEILQAILAADEMPSLENVRPLKVLNHLKSEAARIARSSGSLASTSETQEILDQILLEPDIGETGKCFHGKAIFNELKTQNI